jgi:hypothetical protein
MISRPHSLRLFKRFSSITSSPSIIPITLHLNLLHQKVFNIPLPNNQESSLILPLKIAAGNTLGDLLIAFREELNAPDAEYYTTSSLNVKSLLHHSKVDIQNLLDGKIDIGNYSR